MCAAIAAELQEALKAQSALLLAMETFARTLPSRAATFQAEAYAYKYLKIDDVSYVITARQRGGEGLVCLNQVLPDDTPNLPEPGEPLPKDALLAFRVVGRTLVSAHLPESSPNTDTLRKLRDLVQDNWNRLATTPGAPPDADPLPPPSAEPDLVTPARAPRPAAPLP